MFFHAKNYLDSTGLTYGHPKYGKPQFKLVFFPYFSLLHVLKKELPNYVNDLIENKKDLTQNTFVFDCKPIKEPYEKFIETLNYIGRKHYELLREEVEKPLNNYGSPFQKCKNFPEEELKKYIENLIYIWIKKC